MPTRSSLVAALAIGALLLIPSSAAAKGLEKATVCGADDCVAIDDDDLTPALLEGGSATGPPSQAEGWYRVRLAIGDGRPGGRVFETFTINVLPRSGYIRSRQEFGGALWTEMSPGQQAIYRQVTRWLAPLPADDLKGVTNPKLPPANAAPPAPGIDDESGSSEFPWLIVVGGAAALAALAWALAIARRPRRRQPAHPAA